MGRGKRSPSLPQRGYLLPVAREISLSDGDGRDRRPASDGSFAAERPTAAIRAQAQEIGLAVKRDQAAGWDEAAAVLWRYRDYLVRTPERPSPPPSLQSLLNAGLEGATYDGLEYGEGYGRRYFALLGLVPWRSPHVAFGLKAEGKLHLVDPADSRRSVCGALTRILPHQRAARGHWAAAVGTRHDVVGRRPCQNCLARQDDVPEALERGDFAVLEPGGTFPPTKRTEGMTMVGAVTDALEAAASAPEPPSGDELKMAARQGLTRGLSEIAAPRLAALEWETLRKHWFSTHLRLGQFYRATYEAGKTTAAPPSADQWREVLSDVSFADALRPADEKSGMILDHNEYRHSYERLGEWGVVPGLLACCFPEMLDTIERELEGTTKLLGGTSSDYRERLSDRLDKVWQRADRRRERRGAKTGKTG